MSVSQIYNRLQNALIDDALSFGRVLRLRMN